MMRDCPAVNIFVVSNWDKIFEGAKTKTYNNKRTCSMPNKHGLGYRKIVRSKNGAALFGAWCSLLQVLSRHDKPRQGYCTDTGGVHGRPYSAEDLEILTDIPSKWFTELFSIAQSVGWLTVVEVKDTARIVAIPAVSPRYPLNSDSDLDLDLDLDLDSDSICAEPPSDSTQENSIMTFECTGEIKEWHLTQLKLDEWKETFDTLDVLAQCKVARQWILDNPVRRKTARGMTKFLGGWLNRAVQKGNSNNSPKSGRTVIFDD